jgi:thymidylate synthase (FAD)
MELLEVFGNDLTVVNAARVSFDKESVEFSGADEKLIKYLATHNHISPFFHPQIRMRVKMPIFVAREWFRHTVGFSRNEVSRRYVDSSPECWIPSPESIRERDPKLKQGSKPNSVSDADVVHQLIKTHTEVNVMVYQDLLSKGVAPEIARCILPQSMYTEFIETASLAAYARLYKLRTDPSAQKEIRDYAESLGSIIGPRFPVSWAALTGESAVSVSSVPVSSPST